MQDAPEAYETLILDAMLGDASLFTRADEVEAAWSIVTPLIQMWKEFDTAHSVTQPDKPMKPHKGHDADEIAEQLYFYPAGTWGPEPADRLIERTGRRWRRL